MEMWNGLSHVSKFVFEDTRTGDIDFRLQRGASILQKHAAALDTEKCTGYLPAGSFIWYSRFNMDWVRKELEQPVADETSVPAPARIYAHELGHALGLLDRKMGESVMREGDSFKECRDLGRSVLDDVQESDARNANTCGCYWRRIAAQTPRRP